MPRPPSIHLPSAAVAVALLLLWACNPPPPPPAPVSIALPDAGLRGRANPVEAVITSTDATHYEVELDAMVQAALFGLNGDLKTTVTPTGHRIDAIRSGSIFARLGLLKGDTLVTLDGVPIDGTESLLDAYARVQKAHTTNLTLLREGEPIAITYRIKAAQHATGAPPFVPSPPSSLFPWRDAGSADAVDTPPDDKAIRKLDDTHYEIRRSYLDQLTREPELIARSARIVPSMRDGGMDGFKLFGVRPSTIFGRLGLLNGDTVRAINGASIASPERALEVYAKLKTMKQLTIEISRRDQPLTLTYTVVD